MDFTIKTYRTLLESIINAGYSIQTFEEFIKNPQEKVIVLRHDVDERPHNALKIAALENSLGIRATYYFRILKISNDPVIIRKIKDFGHEIGYHYEDYSLANGNLELAISTFKENLKYFREYYPVSTVCMHGSSFSSFDNRAIWDNYSLNDFQLIAEPYLSVDYSKVFYITDTARCWDGDRYSIRDKVKNKSNLKFHTTKEIVEAFQTGKYPNVSIIQSHTLWTDNVKEWIWLKMRESIRNRLKVIIQKLPGLKNFIYKIIRVYSS